MIEGIRIFFSFFRDIYFKAGFFRKYIQFFYIFNSKPTTGYQKKDEHFKIVLFEKTRFFLLFFCAL